MTLILATGNHHKLLEIRTMMPPTTRVLSWQDLGEVPETVEDAPTFAGNAIKKVQSLGQWIHAHPNRDALCRDLGKRREDMPWIVADDSGLEVDALQGAPGVHSARFASLDASGARSAGNASDADNNAKLLRLLADVPRSQRAARFRCVLALVRFHPDEGVAEPRLFEGVCEGSIAFHPAGSKGFGYDPLFVPDGYDRSLADLGEDTKNRISHRSKALAQLKAFLAD